MEDEDISESLKLLFMEEVWRPVIGYKGRYQVSNYGRVWSAKTKKLIHFINNDYNDYYGLVLSINRIRKYCRINRLVAEAFLGLIDDKLIVNHKNGNKLDNRLDNLEIITQKENTYHARKNGLVKLFKRAVLQYDKDMNFIQRFESIKEAGDNTGTNKGSISATCKGKQKTAGGFIWRYEKEENKVSIDNVEGKVLNEYPNYIVTKEGKIYSKKYSRFLRLNKRNGYVILLLTNNKGIRNKIRAHILVARAYIKNPENKPYVDHINGIRDDNRKENLRWATQSENISYSYCLKDYSYKRAVNQFDKEGNLVGTFFSVKKASEAVSVYHANISKACRDITKTCKGFIWKYVE